MKKYFCPCKSGSLKEVIVFKSKPKGETDFLIPEENYYRRYLQCSLCGHFVSELEFDISSILELYDTVLLFFDESFQSYLLL